MKNTIPAIRALIWQQWRLARWLSLAFMTSSLVCVLGLAYIGKRCNRLDDFAGLSEFILFVFFIELAFILRGTVAGDENGFPVRVYRLPIGTPTLVATHFIFRLTLLVFLVGVTWLLHATYFAPFVVPGLLHETTFCLVIAVCIFILAGPPSHMEFQLLVFVLSLVACIPLLSNAFIREAVVPLWRDSVAPFLESHKYSLLAAICAVSYLSATVGASLERRGRIRLYQGNGNPFAWFSWRFGFGANLAFRSPYQAERWFENQVTGGLVALCLLIVVGFPLCLPCVLLLQGIRVEIALHSAGNLFMPAAAMAALAFGGFNWYVCEMPSTQARWCWLRPLSTGELARIRLHRSLAFATMFSLIAGTMLLIWWGFTYRSSGDALMLFPRFSVSMNERICEAFGGILFCWCLCTLPCVNRYILFFALLSMVDDIMNPDWQWMILPVGVLILVSVFSAFRTAYRLRLVRKNALIAAATAWGLFAIVVSVVFGNPVANAHSAQLLLLFALALAPLATVPIGIHEARHGQSWLANVSRR